MPVSSSPTTSTESDYVIVGLAHCFTKQEGEITSIMLLEPVPSAYFEALLQGVPTSYKTLYGCRLSDILKGKQLDITQFPEAAKTAQFCEDFVERALAAARTYEAKSEIQKTLPTGETFADVNFSTERKRVLNAAYKVTAEDNVKQHKYTHMTL